MTLFMIAFVPSCYAFQTHTLSILNNPSWSRMTTTGISLKSVYEDDNETSIKMKENNRRTFVSNILTTSNLLFLSQWTIPKPSFASSSTDTATATVADKIFIEFQGLPTTSDTSSSTTTNSFDAASNANRIVIGLFGSDAPQPVSILKQLVSKGSASYQAPCQPRAIRTLQ